MIVLGAKIIELLSGERLTDQHNPQPTLGALRTCSPGVISLVLPRS
jgi:hypothetical protein